MGMKTAIATEIALLFLFFHFRPVESFGGGPLRRASPAAPPVDFDLTEHGAFGASVPMSTATTGPERSAFEQLRRVPLLAQLVLSRVGELCRDVRDEGTIIEGERPSVREVALYGAILLLAPPLAAAREAVLYGTHLLRQPVVQLRGAGRAAVNSLKYVAYVTSASPAPASRYDRVRQTRVPAGDAPARAAPNAAPVRHLVPLLS